MRINLRTLFFTTIAMLAGFIVLSGYFVEIDPLLELRLRFVNWSVILAAVAMIVGVVYIIRTHWGRIKSRQAGWFYSLALLICLVATFLISIYFGPVSKASMFIFNYILSPIEMSMMGLLVVIVLMVSVKLLKKRPSGFSILFLGVVVLVILGSISMPGMENQLFGEMKNWIVQTWAGAGARGILLGVVLGTVTAGFRILLGVERPYSD